MRGCFLSLLLGVLFFPVSAMAEDCAKASSSADVMRCLSGQNERLQEELNSVFDQLSAQSSGEALVKVKDVQGRWIQYRDLECARETDNINRQSLGRLEKLRCLNRLTGERVNAIRTNLQNEERATLGETGAPPRWMNALAVDYPETFWRYGARVVGDLDCDQIDEYVIEGARVDIKTNRIVPVLAISENPRVGRPVSTVIERYYTAEAEGDEEKMPCDFVNDLQFDKAHEEPVADTDFVVCKNAILVQSNACGMQRLFWDGKAYGFETPPVDAP